MSEFVSINKPGLDRPLTPKAIVLLDPSNGRAIGSDEQPLRVAMVTLPRITEPLLSAATTVTTGDFVETKTGGFSVSVSGKTTSGSGAATVVIEGSHDGITPVTLATVTLTLGTATTSDGFAGAVSWRYLRARLSAISGTGSEINATVGV